MTSQTPELKYCSSCIQMTNHNSSTCLKCGLASQTPEVTPRKDFGFEPKHPDGLPTQDTEVEEWEERFDMLFDHIKPLDKHIPAHIDTRDYADIKKFIHHQLQKARQDWLREEIVRLEGMIKEEKEKGTYDRWQDGRQDGFIEALQTIIDRYQAELDQEVSK